jgi:hypothetical protein
MIGKDPGDGVGDPAGRHRHDDGDGARRILLRRAVGAKAGSAAAPAARRKTTRRASFIVVSTQWPRTVPGQPGAERLRTPAPADHVAARVVGGHAEPIAIGPWQGFPIGVIHIPGGREG